MGLNDTLSPMIKPVMFGMYGLYVLLGIILTAVGAIIAAKKLTQSVAWGMIFAGVAMILIGGVCLFVVSSELWFPMMILQLINFGLFIFILVSGMVAFFIGAGYSDPVAETYDELYEDFRVADGAALDKGVCYTLADGNELKDLNAGQNWDNCRSVYMLTNDECDASAVSSAVIGAFDVWEDWLVSFGNCSHMASIATDGAADGTGMGYMLDGDGVWSSATCGEVASNSRDACSACHDECKENLISITKNATKAIAIAMFAFWFFFVLTALINNHVIQMTAEESDDEEESWADSVSQLFKILIYIFDGLVILLALVITIIGIAGFVYSNSEESCPMKNTGAECPGGAFMVVSIIGFGLLVCGALTVVGLLMSMKFLVIVANTVFIFLCIGLLACVVLAGLATGVFGAATTQFDANYIARRDDIRGLGDDDQFVTFCAETCEAGGTNLCENDADGNLCADDECNLCITGDECWECRDVADSTYFTDEVNCYSFDGADHVCKSNCRIESGLDCPEGFEATLGFGGCTFPEDHVYADGTSADDYGDRITCDTFTMSSGDFTDFAFVLSAESEAALQNIIDNEDCNDDDAAGSIISDPAVCGLVCDAADAECVENENAVEGCSRCYIKEDLVCDSFGLDTNDDICADENVKTIMCLECEDTTCADGDTECDVSPQFINRYPLSAVLGGWDDGYKTSTECTTTIESAPVDDIYSSSCSAEIQYTGCKAYSGPKDGYKDLDGDECKEDIRDKVEDYMRPLGITALVVCVFFVGIMFFTQLAVDIWKAGGDDDDGDDDDE